MSFKKGFIFFSLMALSAYSIFASEKSLSVDEIVQKANLSAYYKGKDGKASVTMTIVDKEGRKRTREFNILRKDIADGADQKFYLYFKAPADVRKMVFMVWKYVGKDDDRWLYLPALDLVKRISASDKRTSFVGSDFVYEDVSGRNLSEDKHELIETEGKHYVIKNTPLDPKGLAFSSYTMWIDKENFLPMKAEYFDKAGEKYRVVEVLKTAVIQGYPSITLSKVSHLTKGSSTTMKFEKVEYDIGLKESDFTERYLRRAPKAARR